MSAETTIHMRWRALGRKSSLAVLLLAICGVSMRTSIDVLTYFRCVRARLQVRRNTAYVGRTSRRIVFFYAARAVMARRPWRDGGIGRTEGRQ
jgi:hypothetical protein